jgi:hypothetical protein
MLDDSGSMRGRYSYSKGDYDDKPWKDLIKAFDGFMNLLS